MAHVALQPQARAAGRPGRGPWQSCREIAPVSSNRAWTDGEFQSKLTAFGDVAVSRFEASQALLDPGGVQVEADAARPHQAPAEAAAAQESRQVEEVAAEPAAVGRGRQEPDVAGQRRQVAGVVGQPLQLQGDAAQHLGADGNLQPARASSAWQ